MSKKQLVRIWILRMSEAQEMVMGGGWRGWGA